MGWERIVGTYVSVQWRERERERENIRMIYNVASRLREPYRIFAIVITRPGLSTF